MAKRLTSIPTNISEYPNSFKRQDAFPLEAYEVFTSMDDAKEYAKNNPIAYVGQLIKVDSGNGKVLCYVIADELGNLGNIQSDIPAVDLSNYPNRGEVSTEIDNTLSNYYNKAEVHTEIKKAIDNIDNIEENIVVSSEPPIMVGQVVEKETIWIQPLPKDTGAVDYIVEHGVTDNTYYEKWNSGIIKYYVKEVLTQSHIYGAHDSFKNTILIPTVKNIIDYKISAYPSYTTEYNDWWVEVLGSILKLIPQSDSGVQCDYVLRVVGSYNNGYNLDNVDSVTVTHSIIGFWK